ncbi:hypothetical protein V496_04263 [Pseudogymnoascus sp. VKM F-4515 (FW-2607)]|nr:hypothetical protein V496_04263 [Pseudogymnoascus sp. VKM F-4515 (FW-2607)]
MPQAAPVERRYAAIPDMDNGLSPRHFLASSPQLEERQESWVCPEPNSHRCEDTGFPNECCPDTEFCFVDRDFNSGCCAIGNNCASVNICTDTDLFYCHTTSTITAATTRRASSGSSTAPSTITSAPDPNTTVLAACSLPAVPSRPAPPPTSRAPMASAAAVTPALTAPHRSPQATAPAAPRPLPSSV